MDQEYWNLAIHHGHARRLMILSFEFFPLQWYNLKTAKNYIQSEPRLGIEYG